MKDFIQKEINDHDQKMIDWLEERSSVYFDSTPFDLEDFQTEDGYNKAHNILVRWYHEEEASMGML